MFKNSTSIVTAGLLAILMHSSCSKKPSLPQPAEGDELSKVELNGKYLAGDQIDSAIATWNLNGQQQQVLLAKNNDTLFANLKNFETGTGQLSIQVFSSKSFGGFYSSRWFLQKQVTISRQQNLKLEGPKEFNDLQWKPRVELKDAVDHFAVVALRPDDPYFFIKDVPADLEKIVVARDYWKQGGGVFRVGGGEWQCVSECTNSEGNIENASFFLFLPGQIQTSEWNHIEITILYVQDQWGAGPVLSFTHTL